MANAESSPSVYEQILDNQEARDAYFNTTQGILYGNPDQPETKEVIQMLDEATIAYLFNPDKYRARPQFVTSQGAAGGGKMIGRGKEDIAYIIRQLK